VRLGPGTATRRAGKPLPVAAEAAGRPVVQERVARLRGGRTGAGSGGAFALGGSTSGRDGGVATMTGGTPGSGVATSTAATCCRQFGSTSKSGEIGVSGLNELSGMVASRAHPGVLFAHADSGAGAVFYAMSIAGASLGTFTLGGATATDWEDIAVGPGPSPGTFVYVGDFGDNAARTGSGNARGEIQIYRVPEPDVDATSAVGAQSLGAWERLRFTYPDNAHDAESLLVDPSTGDILIVTKETNGASRVFRAAGDTPTDTTTVLALVATLSLGSSGSQGALVSAGDISPSGDSIILRTYTAIWLWCRGSTWANTFGAVPVELPSATEPQSEGLTFSADGKSWYSAGESATTIYQASSSCSP